MIKNQLLARFSKREYLEDLMSGNIRFSSYKPYIELGKKGNSSVGDEHEFSILKDVIYQNGVIVKDKVQFTAECSAVDLEGLLKNDNNLLDMIDSKNILKPNDTVAKTSIVATPKINANLLSCTIIEDSDFSSSDITRYDSRISFGLKTKIGLQKLCAENNYDSVMVFNFSQFSSLLEKRCREENIELHHCCVQYEDNRDEEVYLEAVKGQINQIAFRKNNDYACQQEYRFLLYPDAYYEAKYIRIGDMSSFAGIVDKDVLLDAKLYLRNEGDKTIFGFHSI